MQRTCREDGKIKSPSASKLIITSDQHKMLQRKERQEQQSPALWCGLLPVLFLSRYFMPRHDCVDSLTCRTRHDHSSLAVAGDSGNCAFQHWKETTQSWSASTNEAAEMLQNTCEARNQENLRSAVSPLCR